MHMSHPLLLKFFSAAFWLKDWLGCDHLEAGRVDFGSRLWGTGGLSFFTWQESLESQPVRRVLANTNRCWFKLSEFERSLAIQQRGKLIILCQTIQDILHKANSVFIFHFSIKTFPKYCIITVFKNYCHDRNHDRKTRKLTMHNYSCSFCQNENKKR